MSSRKQRGCDAAATRARCARGVIRILVAASVALAVGCPGPPAKRTTPPAPPPRIDAGVAAPAVHDGPPRLVVLVIVDQLPSWAFAEKRPHLTGGFARLLRDGEWHTGVHPSIATLTAPGHALLGSGAPPARSGVVANEWYHRDLDRVLAAVEDVDGSSTARWMRVPGLGDAVAAAGRGGKAVGISLKERAAILPLGQAGTAIWYDKKRVGWSSNDPAARTWLATHGEKHPIAPRLAAPWVPLDAARLAELSKTVDDQRGEVGEKGLDATFPHAPRDTKDAADAVLSIPLGNEIVFEVAAAAIANAQLGADDAADLLVLSLSAHDYVGHGWGQESWEMWDMTLRLDAQLGAFLDLLDARIGAGRWALALTSDHGASPLPERVGGGRIVYEEVGEAANRAASLAIGPGTWIAHAKYPTLYLSPALLAKPPELRKKALHKITLALRAFPGIARVGFTADVAGDCDRRSGEDRLICLALDPAASGELFWVPKSGWITEERDERLATAHGSPHAYDREVPVILLPPGRRTHEPLTAPSSTMPIEDIAALVARWLDVSAPASLPRAARDNKR